MATITFDTLKFVELRLEEFLKRKLRLKQKHWSLFFSEVMDSQLATKLDINRLEREVLVIKWMVGLVLGGILTLISKILPQATEFDKA